MFGDFVDSRGEDSFTGRKTKESSVISKPMVYLLNLKGECLSRLLDPGGEV
jgi:hypothetical protein